MKVSAKLDCACWLFFALTVLLLVVSDEVTIPASVLVVGAVYGVGGDILRALGK